MWIVVAESMIVMIRMLIMVVTVMIRVFLTVLVVLVVIRVFFAVLVSTLLQGTTFEPLAARFGATTSEPALPRPLAEGGTIRRLGAEILEYPIAADDAIVGHRVSAPKTAMLGPTCIYQAERSRQAVTLSVLHMAVAPATRNSRGVVKATVGGHRAYCVNSGGLKMLVPLSNGRVLSVTAACPIAARFAAKALARLGN